MAKQETTEQLILKAATKVFKEKGYDGTRVQDIADAARTTKSMVNYYFRSKDRLFGAVFRAQFQQFFEGIAGFISSDLPLYEKIVRIVDLDTEKLSAFPQLPVFIINEINRNPEMVSEIIGDHPTHALAALNKQIEREVKKGAIRKIRAEDLLLNIQALTVFPYLAKPLQMMIFKLSEKQVNGRLIERKKMIVDMVWNSIKA